MLLKQLRSLLYSLAVIFFLSIAYGQLSGKQFCGFVNEALYKKSRTCNFGFIFYFLLFTKYRSFKWVPGCIYFLPYSLTEDKGWNSVLSVAFRNFWVYKCANIEEEKIRAKYVTSDNITHSLDKWNLGMKWEKIARKKLSPPIEWTNERANNAMCTAKKHMSIFMEPLGVCQNIIYEINTEQREAKNDNTFGGEVWNKISFLRLISFTIRAYK